MDELVLPQTEPIEDGGDNAPATDEIDTDDASDGLGASSDALGSVYVATDPVSLKNLSFTVTEEHANTRIDLYLTLMIDGYSRVFLRRVVMNESVLVDGRPVKPAFRVFPGQVVQIVDLPPAPTDGPIPEAIPLDVLYEDEYLVAINKPAGMVVHPAKGHWSGTLTAALAHHFKELSDAGGPTRPGIVHRLDRETSGVILIAKTNEVHFKLCAQFEARDVHKSYITIVSGRLDRDRDRIIQAIGHHPYQREKMAIRNGHPSSRYAETQFEVTHRFPGYAVLQVFPKTGRTHQIRVHLAHIGCPVLCDRLYAGHTQITRGQLLRRQARGLPNREQDSEVILERQALHAAQIEFTHPRSGQPIVISAPLAADMQRVIDVLQQGD
ncbi:MAG: RluA family pseudouridine synthase [Planctomycetes bacterium]|nr:RluA family pseudouridine synthase [Planctomycetota bacterium]